MANSPSVTAGALAPQARRSAIGVLLGNLAIQRLGLVIILGLLWQVYAQFFANHALLAPPSDIIKAMGTKIFGDPQVRRAIWLALWEIAVAYLLAVAAGLTAGIAIGFTDFGRKSFLPIVLLLYAVPQVLLLPLFMLIFGIGPISKIAFGFTHGFFPVVFNTIAGMRSTNPLLIRSATSMGASRQQIIRHVIFPNMVPQVFAGLRLGMTVTLLGVLLAELFVSVNGIGYFAQMFGETYDPAPLFALIVTLAILAIGMNELVRLIERHFTRWKS